MTNILRLSAAASLIGLAACSQAPAEPAALTQGEWAVDSDASRLSYVTVKSDEIAETNEFTGISGNVAADGAAVFEIDLATVSTGVDIRDERMRDVFFEVANHPTATVTAQLDPAAFETLAISEATVQPIKGTLSVKGVETSFAAEVEVTRISEDRVLAVSTKPVIVYADALELTGGLAQLQELAGLPSITPVVPVTFSLAIQR